MASVLAAGFGGPARVVTGELRVGDVRHVTASADRVRRDLHFVAEVPFDAGMAELATAPLRS
jgi:dTDP-L-rhamnose 4-epimerase